ncbi:MAG TPA: hypothetical protein VND01_00780 [Candidatus Acidoferrales bacterium]|nr:hypothetical protein [Candidatus Acidoferrales bacterium]
MSMPETKNLSVSKLNVDTGNFRIGEFADRRAAYKAMIDEEGGNLISLAEDIVENGLSPAEKFIVVPDPDENGNYIVCEGNRRLTALKMLEVPELAHDTKYTKAFSRLSKKYMQSPIDKLECVILDDKDKALPWIERKHTRMEGRGVTPWSAPAQARAEAYRGRVRPSKAVLDFLKSKGKLTRALEEGLRRRTTNLDRVFQMPYLRKSLGVIIEKNGKVGFENNQTKAGTDLLLKMVNKLAEAVFNVNKIRDIDQRKDFIDGFKTDAVKSVASNAENGANGKNGKRRAMPTTGRDCLALKGKAYTLAIDDPRLQHLYIEAQKLRPEGLANCAAILTRVFLELTTEFYLEKLQILIPKKHLEKNRRNWSDQGISLKEKIQTVLQQLDPSGREKALANARRGLTGDDYLHSVTTLHQYLHDIYMDADPTEVKKAWERWHPYFSRVFAAINTQSSSANKVPPNK